MPAMIPVKMRDMTIRSLSILFSLFAMAAAALASDIMVINAHAPASLTPMAKSGAVYLTFINHGKDRDALLSISSDVATHTEAHQTSVEDGVMKMRALDRLEIAPEETVAFAPGGHHIMLMGLKAPMKDGDTVSLVLTFEKAGAVEVKVPVVGKTSAAVQDP
jgi:periplasmic copper chaperone A